MLRWVVISMLICSSMESMSESFLVWVSQTYGEEIADRLNRTDLGDIGSFGGGNHTAGEQTLHQPVILVHGVTGSAGRYLDIREFFLNGNYTDAEVYATTYGDAGETEMMLVVMDCDYVKRVRELIIAVSAYTNSTVDVIGYSMGSPIARKAILGGECVDTKEHLGEPLTDLVDTYVGVGGANFGSILCFIPLFLCNTNNGLSCGSRYLNDINSKRRYEGSYIFTIHSTDDEYIGNVTCGRAGGVINGRNEDVELNGLRHVQTLKMTAPIQYNFVTRHRDDTNLDGIYESLGD